MLLSSPDRRRPFDGVRSPPERHFPKGVVPSARLSILIYFMLRRQITLQLVLNFFLPRNLQGLETAARLGDRRNSLRVTVFAPFKSTLQFAHVTLTLPFFLLLLPHRHLSARHAL